MRRSFAREVVKIRNELNQLYREQLLIFRRFVKFFIFQQCKVTYHGKVQSGETDENSRKYIEPIEKIRITRVSCENHAVFKRGDVTTDYPGYAIDSDSDVNHHIPRARVRFEEPVQRDQFRDIL